MDEKENQQQENEEPVKEGQEDEQRSQEYLELIEQLLRCPNGKEPEILDARMDLIDVGLVSMMMRVATSMAHQDNQDGAKFLIYIARELSRQLGLYPEDFKKEVPAQ